MHELSVGQTPVAKDISGVSSTGAATTGAAIASTSALDKSFADKKALDKVDIDIQAGQVLAILGANGAGKTTLINILLGRLKADAGQAMVFEAEAGALSAKRQSGAMLQVANLPETLKIKEHIQLFQSYYPEPMDYKKVIQYAGLEALQDRYSKKLSGGEKQRLLFALSICGNPRLLFLDEPSVGMDVEARQGLWQAIRDLKAQGTAIVLTTHYLEEADSLADEIVLLKQGEVIKRGSSEDIKASVSHTSIRFHAPELHDLSIVRQIKGVLEVKEIGKFIQIQSSDVNQTLLNLLANLPQIQDLTVTSAGLEEAFLHLNDDTSNVGDTL